MTILEISYISHATVTDMRSASVNDFEQPYVERVLNLLLEATTCCVYLQPLLEGSNLYLAKSTAKGKD